MARPKSTRKSGEGTLYKRNGIYHLQYMINGKRRQKSTKTGDIREANKVAKEILATVKGTNSLLDVVRNTAQDKGIVDEAKLSEIEKTVSSNVERTIPLSDSWQAYLDCTNRPDSGPETLVAYKCYWKAFSEAVSSKRNYIHEVTVEDARDFAKILQARPISAKTYNKYINFCKLYFKSLSYEAGISDNPFKNIAPKYAKATEKDTEKQTLTREQLDDVYDGITQLETKEYEQAEKKKMLSFTGIVPVSI